MRRRLEFCRLGGSAERSLRVWRTGCLKSFHQLDFRYESLVSFLQSMTAILSFSAIA